MQSCMDVHPAQQHIEQRDESQKADEHDGHVQRQFAAVDGSAGSVAMAPIRFSS